MASWALFFFINVGVFLLVSVFPSLPNGSCRPGRRKSGEGAPQDSWENMQGRSPGGSIHERVEVELKVVQDRSSQVRNNVFGSQEVSFVQVIFEGD